METKTINISEVITQCAIKAACEVYSLDREKLLSETRERMIVWARRMCMKIIREETALSLQAIANVFGKDHASILHSIRQHDALIEIEDKEYMAIYSEFMARYNKFKAFDLGDAYDKQTMLVKRIHEIKNRIQLLAEEAAMLIDEYVKH